MTISKDYKDKVAALVAELAEAEKAEREAAAERAAYDKKIEDSVNTSCYDLAGFKKKYPRAYEDALYHAKVVCDSEDVQSIADELSIIMFIVELAVSEAAFSAVYRSLR